MVIHVSSFTLKLRNGNRGDDGGETSEITVYEYFTKHRGIELKHSAFMPCLDVGKPKRPIYMPLEVRNSFCSYVLKSELSLFFLHNSLASFKKLVSCFFSSSAVLSGSSTKIHKSIITDAESIFN